MFIEIFNILIHRKKFYDSVFSVVELCTRLRSQNDMCIKKIHFRKFIIYNLFLY